MSFSDSVWNEANAFLLSLGYDGSVFSRPEFQFDATRFLEMLLTKNEEVNLTGAKDVETAFWKHFVDSLSILSLPDLGITADWGCGGGFPGIPLALARKYSGDSTPVYFVDSIGKKVRAVEEFCSVLGLKNTQGFVGRGEELIRNGSLQKVNSVVMRAVAPAERAWKWITPEVPNWVFFLGPRQREEWSRELPKVAKKKFAVRDEKTFSLPRDLGQRCLLRLSKSSTWN